MRIPGLLASINRLARAVNWSVAYTTNLLVALPVLEATVCKFAVRAVSLMAMLCVCAVYDQVVVSMAALACGVHWFVANVTLLVR